MTNKLFVYGTLHPQRAPLEVRDVVKRMRAIDAGHVRGELYDLGEYPGATLAGGTDVIAGTVFQLPNDVAAIEALDEYEEYDPKHPGRSLFRRVLCMPTLRNGKRVRAWAYVYNRPTSGLPRITSGRWSDRRSKSKAA